MVSQTDPRWFLFCSQSDNRHDFHGDFDLAAWINASPAMEHFTFGQGHKEIWGGETIGGAVEKKLLNQIGLQQRAYGEPCINDDGWPEFGPSYPGLVKITNFVYSPENYPRNRAVEHYDITYNEWTRDGDTHTLGGRKTLRGSIDGGKRSGQKNLLGKGLQHLLHHIYMEKNETPTVVIDFGFKLFKRLFSDCARLAQQSAGNRTPDESATPTQRIYKGLVDGGDRWGKVWRKDVFSPWKVYMGAEVLYDPAPKPTEKSLENWRWGLNKDDDTAVVLYYGNGVGEHYKAWQDVKRTDTTPITNLNYKLVDEITTNIKDGLSKTDLLFSNRHVWMYSVDRGGKRNGVALIDGGPKNPSKIFMLNKKSAEIKQGSLSMIKGFFSTLFKQLFECVIRKEADQEGHIQNIGDFLQLLKIKDVNTFQEAYAKNIIPKDGGRMAIGKNTAEHFLAKRMGDWCQAIVAAKNDWILITHDRLLLVFALSIGCKYIVFCESRKKKIPERLTIFRHKSTLDIAKTYQTQIEKRKENIVKLTAEWTTMLAGANIDAVVELYNSRMAVDGNGHQVIEMLVNKLEQNIHHFIKLALDKFIDIIAEEETRLEAPGGHWIGNNLFGINELWIRLANFLNKCHVEIFDYSNQHGKGKIEAVQLNGDEITMLRSNLGPAALAVQAAEEGYLAALGEAGAGAIEANKKAQFETEATAAIFKNLETQEELAHKIINMVKTQNRMEAAWKEWIIGIAKNFLEKDWEVYFEPNTANTPADEPANFDPLWGALNACIDNIGIARKLGLHNSRPEGYPLTPPRAARSSARGRGNVHVSPAKRSWDKYPIDEERDAPPINDKYISYFMLYKDNTDYRALIRTIMEKLRNFITEKHGISDEGGAATTVGASYYGPRLKRKRGGGGGDGGTFLSFLNIAIQRIPSESNQYGGGIESKRLDSFLKHCLIFEIDEPQVDLNSVPLLYCRIFFNKAEPSSLPREELGNNIFLELATKPEEVAGAAAEEVAGAAAEEVAGAAADDSKKKDSFAKDELWANSIFHQMLYIDKKNLQKKMIFVQNYTRLKHLSNYLNTKTAEAAARKYIGDMIYYSKVIKMFHNFAVQRVAKAQRKAVEGGAADEEALEPAEEGAPPPAEEAAPAAAQEDGASPELPKKKKAAAADEGGGETVGGEAAAHAARVAAEYEGLFLWEKIAYDEERFNRLLKINLIDSLLKAKLSPQKYRDTQLFASRLAEEERTQTARRYPTATGWPTAEPRRQLQEEEGLVHLHAAAGAAITTPYPAAAGLPRAAQNSEEGKKMARRAIRQAPAAAAEEVMAATAAARSTKKEEDDVSTGSSAGSSAGSVGSSAPWWGVSPGASTTPSPASSVKSVYTPTSGSPPGSPGAPPPTALDVSPSTPPGADAVNAGTPAGVKSAAKDGAESAPYSPKTLWPQTEDGSPHAGGAKQYIKHTRKFRPIKGLKKTKNNKKQNTQSRRKKKTILKKNTRKKK